MTGKSKAKSNELSDMSYGAAMAELESILAEIESGETDIDKLSDKVQRALGLVRLCKSRLRATDEEVKKIISEFDEPDGDSEIG